MPVEQDRIEIFGTSEPPPELKRVEVGELSLLLDGKSIRSITWKGLEVIRGIAWPVRNEDWITLPQETKSEALTEDQERTRYQLVFAVGNGALACKLDATFGADGVVTADLEMTASRDFSTNRAGFTVLHPLQGVAGEPLTIRHSDGKAEQSRFPRYISPDQPALDIIGLRHAMAGIDVDIAFSGEIFEMEDQRNWTDASYKTYCRPLVMPFPYIIAKGETVRQGIRVALSGNKSTNVTGSDGRIRLQPDGKFPQVALALEDGWLPGESSIRSIENSGVRALQIRTGPSHDSAFLREARKLRDALHAEIDVELVLGEDADPRTQLERASAALQEAGIKPKRAIPMPEPYLKSYQPSGPWPDGPTPTDCSIAARSIFPECEIGGGVLTNFTELNRCRPDPAECGYVSHSTTAIVHAADDRSVIETIEALPYIFDSTMHLSGGCPYRLGLVAIGMRSNPYGAKVADNPEQTRLAMARYDPRQRGLFAAAFAVSALAMTQEFPLLQALALAGPAGPFAIVAEPQEVPRPLFDEDPQALVYPLFHVVRAAAAMSGKPRLKTSGLGSNLAAIAVRDGDSIQMVIANLSEQATQVRLPDKASTRILDADSFKDAIRDPDWLLHARASDGDRVELQPYALAFASGNAV